MRIHAAYTKACAHCPARLADRLGPALALIAVLGAGCGKPSGPGGSRAPAPSAVVVELTEQRDVPLIAELVARTEAAATVELRANVDGRLLDASFHQGRMVRKGQVLFRIDPRRYQAAVESARAAAEKAEADLELAREQQRLVNAQSALRQAEANLLKCNQDVERLKPLAARRAVPERDLEAAIAAQVSAQAAVEDAKATVRTTTVADRMGLRQAEAAVRGAKAALETAELDLAETDVRSPLDGLVGGRNVDVGNYVGRGQASVLATVSRIDPIRLIFNVPESLYLHIMAKGANRSGLDQIELVLSDNTVYPHRGRFSFMGRAVESKTGTLPVEAEFPNPQGYLLPGMFGRVRLAAETRPNAVLVAERAVFDVQGSKAVYIVASNKTVALRSVVTEGSYQGKSIVTSGLKGGEPVVVEGILKVRPGAPVTIQSRAQVRTGGEAN
jgi:membrane fusion protein (multidrug efflux system)